MKFSTLFILQILFFILVTGCAKLETAYNFAPRLSANFLDKYFDFSSERYDKVKEALEKDFKDNKDLFKVSLAKRLDTLQELSGKKELSTEKVDELMKDYRTLQTEVVERFKPSLNEIITKMTADELKHIKKESEETFDKNFENLSDKDKFIKKQLKSFEKNMDWLFDSVTDEQIKIYTEFLEQNFGYYKDQLEFRKSYLAKLESLFDKKDQMMEAAVKYYSGDDSVKPKEFLVKHNVFLKNLNILFQKLWVSLTDKQREEYKKTLAELRKEIDELKPAK